MAQPEVLDEEKWKAIQDAHTLAEAQMIMNDKDRHGKAQEAAKKEKEETAQRAKEANDKNDAMQALASKMYPSMAQDTDGDGQ